MNPSNIGFPCTIGDVIRDAATGVQGVCVGFKVRSDGSKVVGMAWNNHGEPRYHWVSDTRVSAGLSPEQMAERERAAADEAARILREAGQDSVSGNEDRTLDARQPTGNANDTPGGAAQPRSRRRRGGGGEGDAERRESQQR